MQVRKLSIKNLEVGEVYVAYSAKNKSLSSNGDRGVFVKLAEVKGTGVKVQVLGTQLITAITALDSREDAWMYSAPAGDLPVVVNIKDKNAWPGFSPRMEREGWNGKVFNFSMDELYFVEDEESAGYGLTLIRHDGETIDPDTQAPYTNSFLVSNVSPVSPPEWRVPRAQRMGVGAVELPLPPKPVAEEHKAIIEALTPHLKDIVAGHKRDNVSFAKVSADLKKVSKHYSQVCHRAIQENPGFKAAYVLSLGLNRGVPGSWFKSLPVNEEALRLWITYLTSYSPYSEAFITKDPDFIMEYGYILDGTKPNRLVVGGAFATRQVWEKAPRADAFYELYKAGVPIDQAFVFGCQCSEFDGKKLKFAQTGGGHSHLYNERLTDDCILNFIDHAPDYPGAEYQKDNAASSRNNGGDYGVDGMWSKSFRVKNASTIFDKLLSIKGGGAWGGAVNIEEGIDKAVDFIEDWQDKVGL